MRFDTAWNAFSFNPPSQTRSLVTEACSRPPRHHWRCQGASGKYLAGGPRDDGALQPAFETHLAARASHRVHETTLLGATRGIKGRHVRSNTVISPSDAKQRGSIQVDHTKQDTRACNGAQNIPRDTEYARGRGDAPDPSRPRGCGGHVDAIDRIEAGPRTRKPRSAQTRRTGWNPPSLLVYMHVYSSSYLLSSSYPRRCASDECVTWSPRKICTRVEVTRTTCMERSRILFTAIVSLISMLHLDFFCRPVSRIGFVSGPGISSESVEACWRACH